MLDRIEYIDNDKRKGIAYDWKLIQKTIKKLKLIPSDCYFPKLNQATWNVLCSDRRAGKTTSWLLVGMIMHELYGTRVHYLREDIDMIMPKNVNDLFNVILENHYIEKVTDNRWNSIEYKSRRWYYTKVDENGVILEKDIEPLMFCMSLDNNVAYKSSYTCTVADLIIFDEFISKRYMRNDFIDLCDILSTLIRDRLSATIVMLANTIDIYSEYFDELEIRNVVEKMNIDDFTTVTTRLGTEIYIHIFQRLITEDKKKSNRKYFGFDNQRLNSIRGGAWSVDEYQHISFEKCDILASNTYVRFNNRYLRLEIAKTELGTVVLCYETKTPIEKHSDCIVYTNSDILYPNDRFRFGHTKYDKLIWSLFDRNRFFYSNNFVGAMLNEYVSVSRKL